MLVLMFPGQGSQHKGMGEGLFDTVSEFLSIENEIDKVLGFSVREYCLENPENLLKQTQYTQPCLFVVNALHYFHKIKTSVEPSYVIGHSLGEYNALLAAGAFDFLTGVKLVKKRGELMAQAKSGGMAAVIGLPQAEIKKVLINSYADDVEIANFNSHQQIVLSGDLEQITALSDSMKSAGAKSYIPLPVSAAFHSTFMTSAAQQYLKYLSEFTFSPLKIPVISNVTALPYPGGDPDITIKSYLYRQITQSVKWYQTIEYLYGQGIENFSEIGPGKVLAKLLEGIPSNTSAELV